jgi:thiamine biosynthesis lipoprotein
VSSYYSKSFEAIGVLNQVTVLDADALPETLAIARCKVAALDAACSRFRDDSELARLNRNAGRTVEVGPLLLETISAALRSAEATGGLVDPTVGRALRALGYDRDFDVVVQRSPHPSFSLTPASGWRSVQFDLDRGTVTLRRGTELDLGATAKAFAADRIAETAHTATGAAVLVSLGGDIAVRGAPPEGWPILVTDHHRSASTAGQTVAIHSGGVATSSTTVRRRRSGTVVLHHIVDPATGSPAPEHWRTVSVAAHSCLDANTAGTAAILEGERALARLEAQGLPARLVRLDGSVATTAGWPEELAA